MTITLKYINAGLSHSQAFTPLSVKGIDAFDEVGFFPPIKTVSLSGSRKVQCAGIFRIFTISFDIRELDDTALIYLINYVGSGFPVDYVHRQYVDFNNGEGFIYVVLEDPAKQMSEWLNGVRFAKKINLRLEEKNLLTEWPGGTPSPDTTSAEMYFKKRVQITGTVGSPQTITLSGTDDSGATFPLINTTTYSYDVKTDGFAHQDSSVSIVDGTLGLSGGATGYVTFQVIQSMAGAAAGDGNYYADIYLWVKVKT